MLFQHLVPAVVVLSGLSPLVIASPADVLPRSVTYHEGGQVEIAIRGENLLETRRIFLKNWSGWSSDNKDDIVASWNNMIDMAKKIRGHTDFNELVAKDSLGPPSCNQRYQGAIEKMTDEVTGWQIGSFIDWHLEMTCDDPVRTETIIRQNHEPRCPKGTKKEDEDKCKLPRLLKKLMVAFS